AMPSKKVLVFRVLRVDDVSMGERLGLPFTEVQLNFLTIH
ncbi:MAG: hypothetical protein RLZZ524_207, partial [Pseudomonadota bacterium]